MSWTNTKDICYGINIGQCFGKCYGKVLLINAIDQNLWINAMGNAMDKLWIDFINAMDKCGKLYG